MMTFLAALILVGTLAKPVCPPKPVQRYSKGCSYCCCGVVNDGTSTVKQMLEACEKTQDKTCRDMCRSEAKKHGVKAKPPARRSALSPLVLNPRTETCITYATNPPVVVCGTRELEFDPR